MLFKEGEYRPTKFEVYVCHYSTKRTPSKFTMTIPAPRISCAAVTREMCSHPTWKTILVEDCPKTCALCKEAGESLLIRTVRICFHLVIPSNFSVGVHIKHNLQNF